MNPDSIPIVKTGEADYRRSLIKLKMRSGVAVFRLISEVKSCRAAPNKQSATPLPHLFTRSKRLLSTKPDARFYGDGRVEIIHHAANRSLTTINSLNKRIGDTNLVVRQPQRYDRLPDRR